MIETLRIIKGAVATKKLIPVLTHLHIYKDRIQATNGVVSIDAPFPYLEGLNVTVPAQAFVKAANICNGNLTTKLTATGKLTIRHKKFRATLPLLDNEMFPLVTPTAMPAKLQVPILPILEQLRGFVSEDASRPWSRSICFKGGYAYATNNVVIAKVPAPIGFDMIIPAAAIDELLRLGYEPSGAAVTPTSIAFPLNDGAWLSTLLVEEKWPDVENMVPESNPEPLPDNFLDTIKELLPFCEDPKFPIIHLGDFGLSTDEGSMQATIDIGEFPECKFRAEPLMQVAERAYGIDFTAFPKPCPFVGENGLTGVVVGMR